VPGLACVVLLGACPTNGLWVMCCRAVEVIDAAALRLVLLG